MFKEAVLSANGKSKSSGYSLGLVHSCNAKRNSTTWETGEEKYIYITKHRSLLKNPLNLTQQ
jgi:hypothetical protein